MIIPLTSSDIRGTENYLIEVLVLFEVVYLNAALSC